MREAVPSSVTFPGHFGEIESATGAGRRPRFGDVIRSAFAILMRQPAAILGAAFLCFAGVAIFGALLYCALILAIFFNSGSYFAATPGIYTLQMQVQAAAGLFTFLLGRGAISWIALQEERVTLRQALATALRRWRPLLTSSLIYGALITLGMAGITWLLRELRLDVSNYRWIRSDADSIMNMAIVRMLSLVPPDPGAPFSELFAVTRYTLSRLSSSYYGWNSYQLAARNLPAQYLLMGAGGLALVFVTETLLCMRNAVIMRGSGPGTPGSAFGWLSETMRAGGRNFWRVALWRWSVRLAMIVLTAACLTLPIVLHQSLVVPTLVREVRSYWPYPINTSLYGIGVALVGMVLLAFSLVFEARMYAALVPDQ